MKVWYEYLETLEVSMSTYGSVRIMNSIFWITRIKGIVLLSLIMSLIM